MAIDILILSNGPGEIMTWVRPVVGALRQNLGQNNENIRISVILSPCPNATAKEAEIVRHYPEVDRVQSSEHFFSTLLWGKTAENWDWKQKGVVIFLGGDQAFALIIGKRLGYKIVIYAEWEARWYRWVDCFAVRNEAVRAKVPRRYQDKCQVIGDLMVDIPDLSLDYTPKTSIIGLMPGSKPGKLMQGIPLCVTTAQHLANQYPHLQFILPLAPTLTPEKLAVYGDPEKNSIIEEVRGVSCRLVQEEGQFYLKTEQGLKINLITDYPAYQALSQCSLVITTVGANTAELGTLAIPMVILLPTQQLDAMKSWDGMVGIVSRLPFVGSLVAKIVNMMVIKQGKLFAWPNIWAKEEIVPELVGEIYPEEVAQRISDYLNHPESLKTMSDRLKTLRGEKGAASRLVAITAEELKKGII